MNIEESSSEDENVAKSPRTLLQANREKYYNMKQFGNEHFRTRNQTRKALHHGIINKQSTKLAMVISEWDDMSFNLSSVGQVAKKLNKFHKINEEDRELLLNIFTTITDDPNWEEDSFFFQIFESRISISEFFSMLVADREWSYIANKKQTESILELFNKVYGYTEGLSRIEEINKRYQKQRQREFNEKFFDKCTKQHIHTEECGGLLSEEEQAKKLEKSILKDLFSAGN